MRIPFTRISLILFLAIIAYGAFWAIRSIWFRPDNIHIFFKRLPYQHASVFPEDISRVNIPQASLLVPYNSFLNKAPQANSSDTEFWESVRETLEGYQVENWEPIQQYHYENLYWVSKHLSQPNERKKFFPLYAQSIQFIHLMDKVHQIDDKEGAESYVARLKRFEEKIRQYFDAPFVPLDSLSYQVIHDHFRKWVEIAPNQHPLYRAFARKAIAADPTRLNEAEAARLLQEVERIIIERITPIFQEISAQLETFPVTSALPVAPQNSRTYTQQLEFLSSLSLEPDSLHQAAISSLESLFSAQANMEIEKEYASSMEEKLDALHSATAYLRQISSGLFPMIPEAPLEIARYSEPLPDEHHGGSYSFILQEKTGKGQWLIPDSPDTYPPLAYLPAYASYFGSPGLHTLQGAMWKYASPTYLHRQFISFPAFEQGWALYASQCLFRELQAFSHTPATAAGFEHLLKVHLVRCIVDTGIHSQSWSYSEAYSFMERHLFPKFPIQKELLTLYHQPGRGSVAWVGYRKLLQIRKTAQEKMGPDFVLQDFHSRLLKIGPGTFPALEKVLEKIVEK